MNDANAKSFLAALANHSDRFNVTQKALSVVAAGLKAGTIRNAELQDAKTRLDRAAEEIWEVATNYFWMGKGKEIWDNENSQKLFNIRIGTVHEAITASKKLAKLTFSDPWLTAQKEACAIILPVALAIEELKKVAVKGRKVPTEEERIAKEKTMKLGTETASVTNHLMACGTIGQPTPEVGMGATVLSWTDRHAATIVEVSNARVHGMVLQSVTVRWDNYRIVSGNMLDGSAQYEYSTLKNGPTNTFVLTDNGWREVTPRLYKGQPTQSFKLVKGGHGLRIGSRDTYRDPSF